MRITLLALCVCLTASLASGDIIFDQPRFEPPSGDHGVYSVQDQAIGPSDPDLAKAYDNFTIPAPGVILDGVDWGGIWAEPLPGALSDVDFIVEIWNDSSGVPDLSGPIMRKVYEGGNSIGQSGPDMMVQGVPDISPSTSTTVGGGPGAEYWGAIPGTTPGSFSGTNTLGAGTYWISILADQTFENPPPVVDPEWQWHVSESGGDGFYARDRTLDPTGTPEYGLLITDPDGKDLNFTLKGEIIPEPSSILLALTGLVSVGLLRRRRA